MKLDFFFIWKGAQLGPVDPLGPNPVIGWAPWAMEFLIGSNNYTKFRGSQCTFFGGWGVGIGGDGQLM